MIEPTAMVDFRVVGSLPALSPCDRASLLDRSMSANGAEIRETTRRIVDRVCRDGDAALIALAAELDEVSLASLEVPREKCSEALADLPAALRRAMGRAGVDRVFAVGGAGAIAALAYGTATIPRVDRIIGPGNAWVAEAKLQVSAVTGIDSPAGPSELLVIADHTVSARVVALEALAQAE